MLKSADETRIGENRYMRSMLAKSLLVVLSMVAWSSSGAAEPFPSKVITIVVPFPAGGATDVVARAIAQGLSAKIGHQVIVDNRPGANGSLGSALVAKAKPDGYTLVMGGVNTHAMNDALYKSLPYNSLKDFSPITLTARIPIAVVVHPSLPVKSIGELIALAKSQPGQQSYGSSGPGGPHHLAMEMFKSMAKVDIVHVPYRGGAPQLNDLLGGHIKIGAIGLPPALPHIQAGSLRPLAVTESKRSTFLPDLPTIAEAGLPGFEVSYWLGLLGPAGMPDDIVEKLNTEIVAVLKRPDVQDQLAKQGAEVVTSTVAEFRALMQTEVAKWAKVVKDANISLE
jgi:tripartite-type tricarboxylate transporter receptor subunit TctC